MKNFKVIAVIIASLLVMSSCGKEVKASPEKDCSSTSASVTDTEAVITYGDCGADVTTDNVEVTTVLKSIEKEKIKKETTSTLPEIIIPDTDTSDIAPAAESPTNEEAGSEESIDVPTEYPEVEPEKEEPTAEKVMYKPSTHYIHRASCHWADDTCYEIENTEGIKCRKCTECNPEMEIKEEYKEKKPKKKKSKENNQSNSSYDGAWPEDQRLTPWKGTIEGPSGKETYYNLDMSGVVSIMRNMGFNEEEYPYWVRDDGVKCLGNYVMVAACFDIRPRGSTIQTSLGIGLVCDTGGFAYSNPYQLDIAVNWI